MLMSPFNLSAIMHAETQNKRWSNTIFLKNKTIPFKSVEEHWEHTVMLFVLNQNSVVKCTAGCITQWKQNNVQTETSVQFMQALSAVTSDYDTVPRSRATSNVGHFKCWQEVQWSYARRETHFTFLYFNVALQTWRHVVCNQRQPRPKAPISSCRYCVFWLEWLEKDWSELATSSSQSDTRKASNVCKRLRGQTENKRHDRSEDLLFLLYTQKSKRQPPSSLASSFLFCHIIFGLPGLTQHSELASK